MAKISRTPKAYLSFRRFHPIKGTGPETIPTDASYVIARARQLLRGRRTKELRAALRAVNWMLSESPAQKEGWDALERLAIEVDTPPKPRSTSRREKAPKEAPREQARLPHYSSHVYELLRCTDSFDISGLPGLPNATWPVLFAVLALGLIDRACDDEQYYGAWHHDDSTYWEHRCRIETHASSWIVEAMDAVATAESFLRQTTLTESLEHQQREKLSLRTRASAIARHAKTNDAVQALWDFYSPGTHKSIRHATLAFCQCYPDKVAHLKAENRLRTLAERLGKVLRDRPRPPPPPRAT